jgi:uncharacterized membrane protein
MEVLPTPVRVKEEAPNQTPPPEKAISTLAPENRKMFRRALATVATSMLEVRAPRTAGRLISTLPPALTPGGKMAVR